MAAVDPSDVTQPKAKPEVESRFRNQGCAIIGTEKRFAPMMMGGSKDGELVARELAVEAQQGGGMMVGQGSALGKQSMSRFRSEGRAVISDTDPRFLLYHTKATKEGKKEEEHKIDHGPSTIVPPQSSFGRQSLSSKKSAGSFSFGASKRTAHSHATPNALMRDTAKAERRTTKYRSSPSFGFGASSRTQKNRLFGQIVDRSPGPCGYNAAEAQSKLSMGSVLTPKWPTGKKPEPRDKSGRTSTKSIYRF